MKKIAVFASLIALGALHSCSSSQTSSHNSQNSLDWKGVYSGITPCADCEGILTRLTLGDNNTYTLQRRYLGKSEEVLAASGSFEWNKEGNRVTLKNVADGTAPVFYQVGENRLTQLDLDGNAITGQLAGMYVLSKESAGSLNKYWRLVEVNGAPVAADPRRRKEPHMILHTQDNRVTGSGGCNSFTGTYTLQPNDRIRFSPLAATKMFCAGIAETEDMMFKAVQNADSYYLRGDSLQLIRARMAPLAKFVAVYLK
jgi:copper homeostasis protein (lipoprotein)